MTSNEREDYKLRLKVLMEDAKEEISVDWIHEIADGILCEILEGFGLSDIVSLYRQIPKRY